MRFEEVFKRLNAREATAEDVLKFERLTAALETTPGDAMLAVLVALDHYETLYKAIPIRITEAATDALGSFKRNADAQAAASIAEAKADLAKAVSEVATKVAHNISAKQKWRWASGCIAAAFVSVSFFGWYADSNGKDLGYKAGYGAGYTEAKDEKAAAAWANTPQGKEAYKLALAGSVGNLIRCDSPGWYVDKGACFVKPLPNGTAYGWRLP